MKRMDIRMLAILMTFILTFNTLLTDSGMTVHAANGNADAIMTDMEESVSESYLFDVNESDDSDFQTTDTEELLSGVEQNSIMADDEPDDSQETEIGSPEEPLIFDAAGEAVTSEQDTEQNPEQDTEQNPEQGTEQDTEQGTEQGTEQDTEQVINLIENNSAQITANQENTIYLRSTGNEVSKIGIAWTVLDITDISYFELYRDEVKIAEIEAGEEQEYFYSDKNRDEGMSYEYSVAAFTSDEVKLCESNALSLMLCEDWILSDYNKREVLTEDKTVNNLILADSVTLDLNGHTLTVLGNVENYNFYPKIYFNHGSLICNSIKTDYMFYLYMNYEDDYLLVNHDFEYGSHTCGNTNQLTAGTLEIKGNLIADEKQYYYGYNQSGDFTTIFSGNTKQEIIGLASIEYYTYFNHLKICNDSREGVVFDYPPAANKTYISNGCNLSLNMENCSDGMILTEDTVIDGDYLLGIGELNLNGHTLTITGDLNQVSGTININKGKLIVEGDYHNCLEDHLHSYKNPKKGELVSDGLLVMVHPEDYMLVNGNVYIYSRQDENGSMTAGTLEVKGDFENYGYDNRCDSNVYMTDDFELRLSGSAEQNLYIYSSGSRLANIVLENDQVKYGGRIYYSGHIDGEFMDSINQYSEISYVGKLNPELEQFRWNVNTSEPYTNHKPVVFENNLITESDLILGGDMTIHGTLTIDGKLNLSGYTLTVGALHITDNGYVVLSDANSKLIVQGNYTDDSENASAVLNAGEIRIGGNVTVNKHDFVTSGTNKLILSGTAPQIINLNSFTADIISLVINNTSRAGIRLASGELIAGSYSNETMVPFRGYAWNGDVSSNGCILEEDRSISGNFILNGGILDLNGHSLTIEGNFYHKGGTISMNGGSLYTKGDYESGFLDGNQTIQMTDAADVMSVSGDMIVGSVVNERDLLTNGNLYLYGNFKQNIKSYKSYQNFSSSKEFTMHLCGAEKQIICPDSNNLPKLKQLNIANLVIENTGEEGIVFQVPLVVTNYVKDNRCKKTGFVAVCNDTILENTCYRGDLMIYTLQNGTLNETLTVDGNLYLYHENSATLTIDAPLEIKGNLVNYSSVSLKKNIVLHGNFLNYSRFTVNADFEVPGNVTNNSILNINRKMSIAGNLESQGYLYANNELNISGNLVHNQSFYVYSEVSVSGDVESKAPVYIYHKLNVSGNYTNYNSLELISGKLICYGDLQIESGYLELTQNIDTEPYLCVLGNFIEKEACKNSIWTGTLDVSGDMKLLSKDFISPINTTLKLSGERKQTVEIPQRNVKFTNLVYANTSDEGIVTLYHINADTVKNITGCKVECTDSCKTIQPAVLSQNLVLEGDQVFSVGMLDLNGYTLTIQGNLLQGGGNINLNGGKLLINGDYCGMNNQNSALLSIRNAADYLQVDGNFEITSGYDKWEKGTIELKKDIKIEGATVYNGLTVILSGTKKQTVSNQNSYWSRLIIENPEGIECGSRLCIREFIDTKGNRINSTLYLTSNAVVSGNEYDGNVVYSGSNTPITGPLHVKGNVTTESNITLAASLIVDGNYTSSHNLTIAKGNLICEQDLQVKSLIFSDAEGSAVVKGNCNIETASNNQKGILEAKGNLYIGENSSYTSYNWEENKLILSGESIQKIEVPRGIMLGTVELWNPDRDGVYFNIRQTDIAELINHEVPVFFRDENGQYGWTLSEDTILDSDVNIIGGTLDLNGHSLTITGNLYMQDGTLDINCGKLTVEGDLRFQTVLLNDDGYIEKINDSFSYFVMDNREDYVLVKGSFYMQSAYKNPMQKGTLEVRGDYNIITGDSSNFTIYYGYGFTVLLSGNRKQRINFYNKIKNGYSYYTNSYIFDCLKIANTSETGVTTNYKIRVISELSDPNQKLHTEYTIGVPRLSVITSDTINANIETSESDLNHNLQINGDLKCSYSDQKQYNLNGYDLTVNNLYLDGALLPDGGSLRVRNNLTTTSGGYLMMTQDNDYVQIKGDFVIGTYRGRTDSLTAGTLEIGGMVSQASAYENAFVATGTHTTILTGKTGDELQYVTFKHESNKFNHLILWRDTEYYWFTPQLDSICDSYEIRYKDETAPQAVTGLAASKTCASAVTLSWNAAIDNVKVTGYEIYRNQRKVGVTTDTSYCDTGLLPEIEYEYYVKAYDRQRNLSEAGDKITVKTLPDTTAPQAPAGLKMTAKTGSAIKLSWMNATDDVGVQGYKIYRDDILVGRVLKNTLSFKDFVPEKDVLYRYTITAYDAAGNESEPSDGIKASAMDPEIIGITPANNTVLGGQTVTIKVSYKNLGGSNYRAKPEYLDAATGKWISIGNYWYQHQDYYNNIYTNITWNTSDVAQGLCTVRITIYDDDDNSTVKEFLYFIDNEGPAPVTGLQADSINGVVVLSWTPSISEDTKSYEVYRSTEGEPAVRIAGNLTKCSYQDADVVVGQTYEYFIIAKDNFNQYGDFSMPSSVTVTVDEEKPVVTGVTCDGHVLGAGESVKIFAKDNRRVEKLRFYYRPEGDSDWTQANEENETADDNGQLVFFFDTESLAEGTYEIKAIAEDTSGNRSEPYTGVVTVDHTGISKIENPEATPHAGYVTLRWENAEDTDLDYFAVEQKIDGEFEIIRKESKTLGCHVTGLLPNTEYVFRVVGYDTVGNRGLESEEVIVTTTEDTEAPIITGFAPPAMAEYNQEIPLVISAQDNIQLFGLKLSYSYDEENWTEITQVQADSSRNDFRYRFDVSNLAEGKIVIAAEVYDEAGNVSSYEGEVITPSLTIPVRRQ